MQEDMHSFSDAFAIKKKETACEGQYIEGNNVTETAGHLINNLPADISLECFIPHKTSVSYQMWWMMLC